MVRWLPIVVLLSAGCGDPVVNHTYLGEPRMTWQVLFPENELWVMAWLSPSLHFEGAQPLLPDERKDNVGRKLVVWDAPLATYRHEFAQLVPGAKLSFGVFLRLRGKQPFEVVNDVVQRDELLAIGSETIVYVEDPGDSTLLADAYYRLVSSDCPPAREAFFFAKHSQYVPIGFEGDAGTPINAFLPANCRSP